MMQSIKGTTGRALLHYSQKARWEWTRYTLHIFRSRNLFFQRDINCEIHRMWNTWNVEYIECGIQRTCFQAASHSMALAVEQATEGPPVQSNNNLGALNRVRNTLPHCNQRATYWSTHVYVHSICLYICIYTYIYIYVYILHVFMHRSSFAILHKSRTHVCAHIYTYTYIYTHIHIHTYMCITTMGYVSCMNVFEQSLGTEDLESNQMLTEDSCSCYSRILL